MNLIKKHCLKDCGLILIVYTLSYQSGRCSTHLGTAEVSHTSARAGIWPAVGGPSDQCYAGLPLPGDW